MRPAKPNNTLSAHKGSVPVTEQKLFIISACLAGYNCRYDGGNKRFPDLVEKVKSGDAIPLCPEQLGGLPTPRNSAQIIGGDGFDVLSGKARVMNLKGKDVTEQFLRGAGEVLKLARDMGAAGALLCDGSPSCGVEHIRRDGGKAEGMGVCAALLNSAGINVVAATYESGIDDST